MNKYAVLFSLITSFINFSAIPATALEVIEPSSPNDHLPKLPGFIYNGKYYPVSKSGGLYTISNPRPISRRSPSMRNLSAILNEKPEVKEDPKELSQAEISKENKENEVVSQKTVALNSILKSKTKEGAKGNNKITKKVQFHDQMYFYDTNISVRH